MNIIFFGFFSFLILLLTTSDNLTSTTEKNSDTFDLFKALEEHSTFVAIIIALITFLADRYIERKKKKEEFNDRLLRSYETIKNELNDHKKAFNNPGYHKIEDIPNLPFKSMFLNVDAYDSLLHSGLFTHFKSDTQIKLANLYILIRRQNNFLQERMLIQSQFLMTERKEDLQEKLQKNVFDVYDFLLNHYQIEINESLTLVENALEDEKKLIKS